MQSASYALDDFTLIDDEPISMMSVGTLHQDPNELMWSALLRPCIDPTRLSWTSTPCEPPSRLLIPVLKDDAMDYVLSLKDDLADPLTSGYAMLYGHYDPIGLC